ncbi:hypothetical protein OIE43_02490 [Streptomyces pseudovenezuelae]|uniref:hypothetical protein n=1 Tax=Streptomyces pseudovenezuelae TaxID=67350 RepID=UPI002E31EBC2|nr:hypothetical protein [Streptomyces pseudovenezuelae]
MRGDLSLRGSLRSRLLGMSSLVSLCAIIATAWLVVSLTAVAIGRERGQVLSDDARIYETLVGFAATHPYWNGVAPTVRALGRQTGRRITLTDEGRHLLANSASREGRSARPLPARASATVDALAVDTAVTRRPDDPFSDRIDPRAVGLFRLTSRERADLEAAAPRVARCMRGLGPAQDVEVTRAPNGRPEVEVDGRVLDTGDRPLRGRRAAAAHRDREPRARPTGRTRPTTAWPAAMPRRRSRPTI